MTQIKAVFFDCDGVLVDSEIIHYRAFQKVLSPFGVSFDYKKYEERYIGFDDRDAFIEIARDFGKGEIIEKLDVLIGLKNKALREAVEEGLNSFGGVTEFVRKLYETGVSMAVVSGSLRDEVELFVSKLGLDGFFEFYVTAEDVQRSKPDPESYLLAFEKMKFHLGGKLDKRNCIVFEDTPSGIQAARSAGLFTIAITNSFPPADLKEANLIVSSFMDIDINMLSKVCAQGTGE